MTLDRTDRISLTTAIAGHLVLFAALSVHLYAKSPRSFDNPPMEVDLIAASALISSAPMLSDEAPAARLASEEGPIEDATTAAPEPVTTNERPVAPATERPRPAPRTTPKAPPREQPAARSAPERPATARRGRRESTTGNLSGILDGIGKEANNSTSNAAPAQSVGEIRRAISISINSEVRGPWNRCSVTGIDVDQLKTTIVFTLGRNGNLTNFNRVTTRGENASNAAQVERFEECARRAIQLAAPFDLPVENYDYWKTYTLDFEKR